MYALRVKTLLFCYLFIGTAIQQKHGKINITDFQSNSGGFYCKQVFFSAPFQNVTSVKVFPSLSHEGHPDNVNEAAVAMVMSVDYLQFNVCIMEPSRPSGKVTLNWLAFGDNSLPQGVLSGSVSYNVFTSGSSCSVVIFSRVRFGLIDAFFKKKAFSICIHTYILTVVVLTMQLFINIFLSFFHFSRSLIHQKFFSASNTEEIPSARMQCPCGQKI